MNWGPFDDIFFEKMSHDAEKTQRWDPLVSRGIVCHAEKKEKPFWFSSLGQRVHFGDTLKFCRTILVTSGVSKNNTDEKSHDYSRLFSKEKRRLKIASSKTCFAMTLE